MKSYYSPFNFTPNLIISSTFGVKYHLTMKKSCFLGLKYRKKSDYFY